MTDWRVERADWRTDQALLKQIRHQVFVLEQGVPEALEWDQDDALATHWLVYSPTAEAIATARLVNNDHIGRMAVLPAYRNQGVGMALLQAVLTHCRQLGIFAAYLNAQCQAIPFYRAAGFTVCSEVFTDAGIPHQRMQQQLADERLLGQHGGDFAVTDFAHCLLTLTTQARQHLKIFARNLDDDYWQQEPWLQALSVLARRSPNSEIRFLLQQTDSLYRHHHPLPGLQQRLSSRIAIRVMAKDNALLKQDEIIADHCGILLRPHDDPSACRGNFNNLPVARSLSEQFEHQWARGKTDPNLRPLGL